jgi:hypothetical protein
MTNKKPGKKTREAVWAGGKVKYDRRLQKENC